MKQVAIFGVMNPLSPVESAEQVAGLVEASWWVEKNPLGAMDDCGF